MIFWFPEGTPTFTFEEYLRASLFPNPVAVWTDKTGEAGMYFNVNMTMAVIAAYRKGGETMAMLRFMMALRGLPATFMWTGIIGAGVLSASPTADMSTRDKLEILSGVPGTDDSFIERLLKLSFTS